MPKPNLCSFCGNQAERTLLGKYTCSVKKCPGYFVECSLKDWNARPIEDALQARIAELEAENAILKKAWDGLPEIIVNLNDGDLYDVNNLSEALDEYLAKFVTEPAPPEEKC